MKMEPVITVLKIKSTSIMGFAIHVQSKILTVMNVLCLGTNVLNRSLIFTMGNAIDVQKIEFTFMTMSVIVAPRIKRIIMMTNAISVITGSSSMVDLATFVLKVSYFTMTNAIAADRENFIMTTLATNVPKISLSLIKGDAMPKYDLSQI